MKLAAAASVSTGCLQVVCLCQCTTRFPTVASLICSCLASCLISAASTCSLHALQQVVHHVLPWPGR